MKNFLATTAIVMIMGGTVHAAPAAFNSYQATPTDIQASELIGQRIYASEASFTADQTVQAGAEKDWDDIGEINEVILGRDGSVKAVILGVGGFLGIGEKDVAVSMNDVTFVRNGDGVDDYFLVVNTTKEALNGAPAFVAPADEVKTSDAAPADTTNDVAAVPSLTENATPADPATQADDMAANPPAAANETDQQTTASTRTDGAVETAIESDRARLTRPEITRDGYQAAAIEELTSDKLTGARVYGANDEDVGEINRLVMSDAGKVDLIVLDIGGFLGMGEREIAVTPDELNIVRNAAGDDFRVYVDANKAALEAQPEYKAAQK